LPGNKCGVISLFDSLSSKSDQANGSFGMANLLSKSDSEYDFIWSAGCLIFDSGDISRVGLFIASYIGD
jgi:hypothetical protein